MSYKAIVTRITTRPHPNADRLKIGQVVGGIQVIVGIDTQDGDLGVYFPSDGQLSIPFAQANNLIRVKNEDGTYSGGMFDDNRRVRAMNLRGVKSDGFWCPVSYFDFIPGAGVVVSIEGTMFDTLNDIPICNKYATQATREAAAKTKNMPKRENKVISFPEHVDTEQYRYMKDHIHAGSVVHITQKLHGTSQRYGFVEVRRKLTWLEKIALRFGVKVQETAYEYVIGTRRTILADGKGGYYGNEEFRRNVVKGITLRKDEILYFEVVGYTTDGKPIMPEHDATKVGKEFAATWGKSVSYAYGCAPSECAMYVYRITQSGADLSWHEVQRRCKELGLNTVPHMITLIYDGDSDDLDAIVSTLSERPNYIGYGPSEGVVIRVESPDGVLFLKEKTHSFKVMEGIIKSDDSYTDMEESA